MKVMRKKVLFILLSFLIFITGCNKQVEEQPIKKEESFSFYHEENKSRYKAYQKENPALSWKDVVLQVNIGLDYPYYTHISPSKYLNTSKILVNKYFYLEKYVPNHLIELSTDYSKGGIYLVEEASKWFQKLVDDAKQEGIVIRAISAYRSYDYQVKLYNRYVEQEGIEKADTYSARPGFSEHQTGLCVDVDDRKLNFTEFENSKSFEWMQENAYRYGFILRYPKDKEKITGYTYESWHYRYVGEKIAKTIHEKNITFDEYYMEYLEK